MSTDPGFIPFRVCCGQQHFGPQCPDGKVMCDMCFERFEVADLAVDESDGKPWDVCKPCARRDGLV